MMDATASNCVHCLNRELGLSSYGAHLRQVTLDSKMLRAISELPGPLFLLLTFPVFVCLAVYTAVRCIRQGLFGNEYIYAYLDGEKLHQHAVPPSGNSQQTVFRLTVAGLVRRDAIYGTNKEYWFLTREPLTDLVLIADLHGNVIGDVLDPDQPRLSNQLLIVAMYKNAGELWRDRLLTTRYSVSQRDRVRCLKAQRDRLAVGVNTIANDMIESGDLTQVPALRRWHIAMEKLVGSFGDKLAHTWKQEAWKQRRKKRSSKRGIA